MPSHATDLRPALQVGLIAGLTLALAALAQQSAQTVEMRVLGLVIILLGMPAAGYYAARQSRAYQTNIARNVGAIGGLIAGLFVSLTITAVMLAFALDPAVVSALESEVAAQLPAEQLAEARHMGLDLRLLTQISLGLTIACCGLSLPTMGLALGALGGLSFARTRHSARRP